MVLRSEKLKSQYLADQSRYDDFLKNKDFDEDRERIVKSFKYWDIIENLYPYDKIAKAHDMLVPRRVFAKMSECRKEEWDEYKIIMNQFEFDGHYDAVLENFSKGRSVLKQLHIHLIVWKDED
ncbi:MAG: diadenosine tetraphosphate (Ap4A) HIT family hydrolase [Patiriisocius sp.]|jgi:diadenosine tetraphosphate (Ap4A) HIT family hydrolase